MAESELEAWLLASLPRLLKGHCTLAGTKQGWQGAAHAMRLGDGPCLHCGWASQDMLAWPIAQLASGFWRGRR